MDGDALAGAGRFLFTQRRGGVAGLAGDRGVFGLLGQVGVEAMLREELGAAGLVAEEFVALLVALADARDVARKRVRGRIVGVQVLSESRRAV